MIPHDDRGLTLGDGLFETLLALDGALQHAVAHLERLEAGCAAIGLPPPDRGAARRLMMSALAEAGLERGRAAVRLTLTAGSGGRGLDRPLQPRPRMFATAAQHAAPSGPLALATVGVRRNEGSPTANLKTLAYMDCVLARRAATEAGADEALMLNTRGQVACAAAANVFWVAHGRLFTPALSCGVLPGIMRARVIAAAADMGIAVTEAAEPPETVRGAEAMFLTNSLIGVRPVTIWDGRACGRSALVDRLAARTAESDRPL